MKKALLALLTVLLTVLLAACGEPQCPHTETKLEYESEPACAINGYQRKVCTECGAIVEASILVPALGHEKYTVEGQAPTCTNDGFTASEKCRTCGNTLTSAEKIDALGHEYGADDMCIRGCGSHKYGVLHFTECDGGYSVNFGTFGGEEVVIPEEFNGKPVVAIDERGFYDQDGIKSVYIPDSVKTIGAGAFLSCGSMQNVRIGASVTTIGQGAFSTCKSLKAVEFAAGCTITEIPDDCFRSSLALSEINIPNSVKTIGNYAFLDTEIEILNLHEGLTYIGEYAFSSVNLKEIYIPKSVEGIGFLAFEYSTPERVTLPFVGASRTGEPMNNGSTDLDPDKFSYIGIRSAYVVEITDASYIADKAFENFNVKAVILNVGVDTIGESAFSGCSSLMYVNLPVGLDSIGNYAFLNCKKLLEVKNESSLELTIGSTSHGYVAQYAKRVYSSGGSGYKLVDDAFIFFSDITETVLIDYIGKNKVITTPKYDDYGKTYSIGNSAFAQKGIDELTVSRLVTAIGDYAFSSNSSLVKVTFEEDSLLTSIGEGAFASCRSLKSISIPQGVTALAKRTFYNCLSLSSVGIPTNVVSIEQAFEGCVELVLDLPVSLEFFDSFNFKGYKNAEVVGGVYYVDGWAFSANDCPESVTIKDGTIGIGKQIFWTGGYMIRELTVPTSVKVISNFAFSGCGEVERLTIPFLGYSIKDRESNPMYRVGFGFGNSNLTYLNITYGDYVHDNALKDFTGLEEVVICHSVREIGNSAFLGCSALKTVTFEGNSQLTTVGESAFVNCTSLGSVAFPAGVTEIPSGCFRGCTSIDAVEIGEGITSIGYSAFANCTNIKYIVIPKSMTSVLADAFYYCSALTHVYYRGSESEWSAISGDGLEFGSGVTVEYNYAN